MWCRKARVRCNCTCIPTWRRVSSQWRGKFNFEALSLQGCTSMSLVWRVLWKSSALTLHYHCWFAQHQPLRVWMWKCTRGFCSSLNASLELCGQTPLSALWFLLNRDHLETFNYAEKANATSILTVFLVRKKNGVQALTPLSLSSQTDSWVFQRWEQEPWS